MNLVKLLYVSSGLPKGWKPYYVYLILVNGIEVGKLIFREGNNEERYFDGHIGYTIEEEYRGNNYAYKAVLLFKNIAKELGYQEVIITCDPLNLPSKKTILKLNAQYLETKKIPEQFKKYFIEDEKEKEVYLLKL